MTIKRKAILWTIATVLAPLLIYTILSSLYIGAWYLVTGRQGEPPRVVILFSFFYMTPLSLWITVGLWWFFHRRDVRFTELFGTRPRPLRTDVFCGLALGFGWIAVYAGAEVVAFHDMIRLDAAKLRSLPASLSAGFCEEFLMRGFLFWVIAAAGGKTATKVGVSALAFGLAHIFWGPVAMLWTMVLGLTLALVTVWRGSVWPAVIAHALLNLFIEPALFQNSLEAA